MPLAVNVAGAKSKLGGLALILALSSVIMVMGLIDDVRNLKWWIRLGIQFLCATAVAASGMHVTLFGPFADPFVGGVVTVLWIVGLTNSFNMLDNMDGLAASVGLIAAALFCGRKSRSGAYSYRPLCLWSSARSPGFSCTITSRRGSSWAMRAAISWVSCWGP